MVGPWPELNDLKAGMDAGQEFKCRVKSVAQSGDTVVIQWEYLGDFTPGTAMQNARELAMAEPVAAILCSHTPVVKPSGKCFIPGCHNWVGRT